MEDTENRLISEPAPIGSDRLEGHICKYAEKSYRYKYDLGHILLYVVDSSCHIFCKASCIERVIECVCVCVCVCV